MSRVASKKDQRKVSVPASATAPASEQTIHDFDMAQIKTYLTGIVTNTALMAFFHFKLEASVPIYFQIFMGLFRIWDWEMARMHLWGETEAEFPNLKRPFAQPPNPFASLMSAFNPPPEETSNDAPPPDAVAGGGPRVEVIDEDEDKKTK